MRNKTEDTSRNTEKCRIASSKDLKVFVVLYLFNSRALYNNAITQLPEKVFSRLTYLSWL